jgi:hypothetical protein
LEGLLWFLLRMVFDGDGEQTVAGLHLGRGSPPKPPEVEETREEIMVPDRIRSPAPDFSECSGTGTLHT